jgi:hypothetical protein
MVAALAPSLIVENRFAESHFADTVSMIFGRWVVAAGGLAEKSLIPGASNIKLFIAATYRFS